MWVTKLLISPVKKGFFAQKRPNLAQNWHFWSIWAIGTFHPIPDHKTMQTMCLGGFSAFLFILGQALLAHLVPCWWVGLWLWRAGCISQDTYLLYIFDNC